MPDEKLTYKQMVHKIIHDSGYAKEIADLIVRVRKVPSDQEAVKELKRRFDPRDEELLEIHLSKHALECLEGSPSKEPFKTTPTTFILLDFSRMCRE